MKINRRETAILRGLGCRRQNYVGAAYVNAALTIFQFYDFRRAVKMLEKEGIPDEVIARVLSAGSVRRTNPYCF
jgi:hypothetical protein